MTRASSFFSRLISSVSSLPFALPLALDAANAEALRNLRNRIASLRDLTHGVTLKIFAEIRFAHDALPASKLGKKASTNLGAIQSDGAKEAFARYLIETFPSGAFDARKHRSVVEASARMFYSSDTAA